MRIPRQLPNYSSSADAMVAEAAAPESWEVMPEPQAGMSLAQAIAILRFYWKTALIIAASVTVLSAVLIKFLPKTYAATATLIVDPGLKDPLAGASPADNNLAGYVATQLELIQSNAILLRVVDRKHLTIDKDFAGGYSGHDVDGLREYTEKNLAAAIGVDLGRGGELMYISAQAKDSAKAADLANAVADTYIEEEQNRLSGPAGERAARYTADLSELRSKVATAQDNLTAFLQQKGITDVSADATATDTESQALRSLEEHLLDVQNQRRALEAKAAGQQSVADETLVSPMVSQLKTQLALQQNTLAQLSATYGPQHPKVIEIKTQIALTTKQLDSEVRGLSENTSTELQRVKELESKYAQAVAEQRNKVVNLREQQGQGAKLMLELQSAQSVYKRALDGYDQIMFASAGNNSTVSMVSRATPPIKAAKPNKIKLLMIGMVFGIMLGVAVPFAYEFFFNRRLRCRDDIERSLGIPVLAQFGSTTVATVAT